MDWNFGGMGAMAFGWFSSMLTWIIILAVLIIFGILILYIRRARQFQYPCLEVAGLGQGKVSVFTTKAGWFKKNRVFFNLIETGGEQELICKDKSRKIFDVSSVDYHEINGKRGLICKRKDDDPEVLVPIDKVEVDNLKLLLRIAPADYRDAAVDILEKKRKETMTWFEKNAPLIITMGVFLFGLIALIIIFNFAKGESSAWREYAIGVKAAGQAVASTTAP